MVDLYRDIAPTSRVRDVRNKFDFLCYFHDGGVKF